MEQSSAVVSIIFGLFMITCSNCWVFTDINYKQLARSIEDDYYDTDLSDEELKQLKFSLIYPGTKWCGPGNIAENYDDLGTSIETDICCRAHDNCPDLIVAGETKYNLTNTAFFTRLNCVCDNEFRQCLRKANTSAAKQIGTIYFNALGTQCYREDYPVTRCIRRGGWFNRKCLEHEYDIEAPKLYQWFDVPNF